MFKFLKLKMQPTSASSSIRPSAVDNLYQSSSGPPRPLFPRKPQNVCPKRHPNYPIRPHCSRRRSLLHLYSSARRIRPSLPITRPVFRLLLLSQPLNSPYQTPRAPASASDPSRQPAPAPSTKSRSRSTLPCRPRFFASHGGAVSSRGCADVGCGICYAGTV